MTLDEAKGRCLQAMSCQIGLVLRTNDRVKCKARLYAARRALAPSCDDLQFRDAPQSIPEGDIIIVKRHIGGGASVPPGPDLSELGL